MKMISSITSPRLIIRPIILDDAKSYFDAEMASVDELMPRWSWALTDKSVLDINEFIRYARECHGKEPPPEIYFSVISRETNRFLGVIWFFDINWFVPTFELAYWLDTRETGKGYITEAVNALTRACFDFYAAKRVQIKIASDNYKSKGIPARLNFKFECKMENYFFNHVTRKVTSGLLYSCCDKKLLPLMDVEIV